MSSSPSWQYDYITNSDNASRLSFFNKNQILEFDLCFLSLGSKVNCYLNLTKNKISSHELSLEIDGIKYGNFGDILVGDQRILINEEITNLIIKSLHEKKDFFLIVDKNKLTINPSGFEKYYKRLALNKHFFEELIDVLF